MSLLSLIPIIAIGLVALRAFLAATEELNNPSTAPRGDSLGKLNLELVVILACAVAVGVVLGTALMPGSHEFTLRLSIGLGVVALALVWFLWWLARRYLAAHKARAALHSARSEWDAQRWKRF